MFYRHVGCVSVILQSTHMGCRVFLYSFCIYLSVSRFYFGFSCAVQPVFWMWWGLLVLFWVFVDFDWSLFGRSSKILFVSNFFLCVRIYGLEGVVLVGFLWLSPVLSKFVYICWDIGNFVFAFILIDSGVFNMWFWPGRYFMSYNWLTVPMFCTWFVDVLYVRSNILKTLLPADVGVVLLVFWLLPAVLELFGSFPMYLSERRNCWIFRKLLSCGIVDFCSWAPYAFSKGLCYFLLLFFVQSKVSIEYGCLRS